MPEREDSLRIRDWIDIVGMSVICRAFFEHGHGGLHPAHTLPQ